jgi:predicted RNase H-like nuclease (RuvC/YqgF family)
MTPFEINAAKKEIARLEQFIACAEGELQFSPNKEQIRKAIEEKRKIIAELKKQLKNA